MVANTSSPDSLTEKAVAAMRAAVACVIEDHRRRGKPLAVWRDGRAVREFHGIADEVRESGGCYETNQGVGTLQDKTTNRKK